MADDAYIPPRPNTTMSAFFCLEGIARLFNIVIGRTRIIMSCTMLTVALVNQITSWLRHRPLAMVLSQKNSTGKQRNMLPNSVQRPYNATKPMTTKHTIRKRGTGKTRRYWVNIEILVAVNERL